MNDDNNNNRDINNKINSKKINKGDLYVVVSYVDFE